MHKGIFFNLIVIIGLILLTSNNGAVSSAQAQTSNTSVRSIVFPVLGSSSYGNDFGDGRSGGRTHEGNDIFAPKMRPLLAAVDGTVQWVQYPQPEWGYAISLRDADGWQYWYLHVNNDTPGTDDGLGGGLHAYAPDVINGATVKAGQVIGWVGDSGNAESTSPHLHFEIHAPDRSVINPYESLRAATRVTTPVPAPIQSYEIVPYGEFKGGASIASGNFGNGGTLVTGAGPGGGPHVKVFNNDKLVIADFFPYPTAFRGGVNVAAGDIDGDGIDEIITGAGPGGGPHVRILGTNGEPRGSFMAYPNAFRGGVRVAVADIDGDGKAEIITGAGPGGGPHVRVFKADGTPLAGFMAYDKSFRGGIDVAVVPASSQSPARIITSPLIGGGPHIRTFDINGNPDTSFFAYDQGFRGGVKISVINTSSTFQAAGSYQIVTVPASKGGPHIRVFTPQGVEVRDATAFESWWRGGYEVDADKNGTIRLTSSGRRASVRTVVNQSFNFNQGTQGTEGGWRYRR